VRPKIAITLRTLTNLEMVDLQSGDAASRLARATALAAFDDAAAYHFFASLGSPSPHQDIKIRKLCDAKVMHCSDQASAIVRQVRKDSGVSPAVASAMDIQDIKAAALEADRDPVPTQRILSSFLNFYAFNSGWRLQRPTCTGRQRLLRK
jgi:hypothetical protein